MCVCQICLLFSVECVLDQLQQVLETHEVNWRHILSCVSHLLVRHGQTQSLLTGTGSSASDERALRGSHDACLCLCSDLLSRLLRSAFAGFDLEKMVTVFLLARQASLEGAAVFPSYSDWFKVCRVSRRSRMNLMLLCLTLTSCFSCLLVGPAAFTLKAGSPRCSS